MSQGPQAAPGPPLTPFLGSLPLPYYANPQFAYQRFERLTNPPATAAKVFIVPADFVLFVQTASCSFTASAAAGNRTPTLIVQDQDGNAIFQVFSSVSSGPGASQTMFWMANLTSVITIGTTVYMPLPPVILPPGYRLRWDFTSGQAGDQLSGITTLGTAIPTGVVERQAASMADIPPLDSVPVDTSPADGDGTGPGDGTGRGDDGSPGGGPAAEPPLEHVAEPGATPAPPPPAAVGGLEGAAHPPSAPPTPPPPAPGTGVVYVPGAGHPGPSER